MYFPTTRVLTVLELLQSRARIGGRELAERLEVDVRTVRRYIMMLQDLGIPVESERGRYGAYRLRPGFKLPPLMFNDEEALAVTLGLLVARKMGMMVTAPAVEGAIAKIERVLPTMLRDQVQAIQESLVFDMPPPNTTPAQEIVLTLSAAIYNRQRVRIFYRSYQGNATERAMDPYGLVYRSSYWYLVGYCHLRSELRNFRLDRIEHLESCVETFVLPDNFDCADFVVRSLPMTPNRWYVEVLLETTLADVQCMISPAFATLEQVPEGVLLRCYMDNLSEMARILTRLYCPFVVNEPEELRDELRVLAKSIVEMADRVPAVRPGHKAPGLRGVLGG